MDEETLLLEVETAMEEALERMNEEFAGVRTGKASPSLVDSLQVPYPPWWITWISMWPPTSRA